MKKHKEFDRLRNTKKYKDLVRIAQRRQELARKPVFVDGGNVAHYKKGKKPSMKNLLQVWEQLLAFGFKKIFIIVSAAMIHYIDDTETFQELID